MPANISKIPSNPDVWLSRADTAAALTEMGLDITVPTLSTLASRGGGPEFGAWGPHVRYRWRDVMDWAERRLAARRRRGPINPTWRAQEATA